MADCKICFSTDEVAELYDTIQNTTNLTVDELKEILANKAGVNPLCKILNKFLDTIEGKLPDDIASKLNKKIPDLDLKIAEVNKALDEIKNKTKELEEIIPDLEFVNDLRKVKECFNSVKIVREKVEIEDGVFELEKPPTFIFGNPFLNSDYIVKSSDGIYFLEKEPSLLYGKKFLTEVGLAGTMYVKYYTLISDCENV